MEKGLAHTPPPWSTYLIMMDEAGMNEWVWAYIDVCSRHGVFHADGEGILLARPVNSTIPIEWLNELADLRDEPHSHFSPELASQHDAWHVIFAAGEMSQFFELAPYPLPKVVWQRDGRPTTKIYNFDQLKGRIHAKRTQSPA